MPREVTYRLIIVRPNGTRELIATNISHDRAAAMQRFLDSQKLGARLLIEPERRDTL